MITYDALIHFAKTLEGQTLETSARRKRFTVDVIHDRLVFTIENGNLRPNSNASVEKVLEHFNETKSSMPGHYQELTMNASYLMRLLEMMVSE